MYMTNDPDDDEKIACTPAFCYWINWSKGCASKTKLDRTWESKDGVHFVPETIASVEIHSCRADTNEAAHFICQNLCFQWEMSMNYRTSNKRYNSYIIAAHTSCRCSSPIILSLPSVGTYQADQYGIRVSTFFSQRIFRNSFWHPGRQENQQLFYIVSWCQSNFLLTMG
jgi:hypothetical protein